jgi:SAM-dependent methyltransferase
MNLFKTKRRRRDSSQTSIVLEGADHWEDVGKMQFDYLLQEGLQPQHYLLDVGCGSFRGGHFLIDFVEKAPYYGIDRDKSHIDAGMRAVINPSKLVGKDPNVRVVEVSADPIDYSRTLGRSSFDYIWVHAVFDHIPPEAIARSLSDLSQVLGDKGRLYATIFLNPHGPEFREPLIHPRYGSLKGAVVTFPDKEYWHHTISFFEEIVSRIPWLKLDACLYDYPHPLGLRMLRFSKK